MQYAAGAEHSRSPDQQLGIRHVRRRAPVRLTFQASCSWPRRVPVVAATSFRFFSSLAVTWSAFLVATAPRRAITSQSCTVRDQKRPSHAYAEHCRTYLKKTPEGTLGLETTRNDDDTHVANERRASNQKREQDWERDRIMPSQSFTSPQWSINTRWCTLQFDMHIPRVSMPSVALTMKA